MITLTAEETALIEKFLNREIDNPVGEDAVLMGAITEKAHNLLEELNAHEEIGDSLIRWFYNKYKAQEKV